MATFIPSNCSSVRLQSGAALVVGLIMLLVLTLLGLASMQTTSLQERMASNYDQRNLAFQLAETGLRFAEREYWDALRAGMVPPLSGDPNVMGWPAACPSLDQLGCSGMAVSADRACLDAIPMSFWRDIDLPSGVEGQVSYAVILDETGASRCARPEGISRSLSVGAQWQDGDPEIDKTRMFLAQGIAPNGTSVVLVQSFFKGPDDYALVHDDGGS
jgi:Tfp pilus assembly protein PilX